MTTPHEEVPVKVNAFVDRGVAPLVAALNEVEGIVTLDSCEGGVRGAYVFFVCTDHLIELAHDLAATLRRLGSPLFSVAVEWEGSNDSPRGLLSVDVNLVEEAASLIQQFALEQAAVRPVEPGGE